MSDQDLYEKIEAYLNGELKGNALSDFESRVQSDKDLAAQVEIFKDIDTAIKDKPVLNFQKLVAEQGEAFLQETSPKNTIVKKINWRRNLIMAASILLLAVAAFLIMDQSKSSLSGSELFAQNFELYDLNESLRGTDDAPAIFDLGIEKYRSGNFEEAAAIFQNLSNTTSSDMIITFCLANSYLNQKPSNFANARTEYEKIIEEGNSIYVPASKWYLALILLSQDDQSSAKKLLTELNNEGSNWGAKAEKLIGELSR